MNTIPLNKLQKESFVYGVVSVDDMYNKYIKIQGITGKNIFYAKRCNSFGDMSLMKISSNGYHENIGNIFPVNRRCFKICFMYEGFHVEHKIKFINVKAY